MKPLYRGIAVAILHCTIVLSLAGKYAVDRERLPRVWAKTAPIDPNLPVRGRYVRLRLQVETSSEMRGDWIPVRLSVLDNRLVANPIPPDGRVRITRLRNIWTIAEPSAFFIPEHIPDPSRVAPGEELWAEVTVPDNGPVRPLRLGIKKDGVLTPLSLR